MKKISLITILIAGAFTFQACHSPEQRSEDQKNGLPSKDSLANRENKAAEQNKNDDGQPADSYKSKVDEDGASFLKTAAIGGMMEVQCGAYALKTSKNAKIKAFAEKMVTDHSKANAELKLVAKDLNIILPEQFPSDVQNHMNMMMKMTGDAFDKHYIDMMVNDHVKTLELFKSSQESTNEKIKDFAKKTLPVLEQHYVLAKQIHAEIK